MFERLEQLKRACKNKKEIAALIKQAAAAKQKSIESKEKLLNIMDMLIINRINMVEEMQFIENRSRIVPAFCNPDSVSSINARLFSGSQRTAHSLTKVPELVEFFENSYKTKQPQTDFMKQPEKSSAADTPLPN